MENNIIIELEEYLNKMKQKEIRISQIGFIMNQFFINKMTYVIQNDILSLQDETKNIYLSLNLNQAYQIEIGENNMSLFLDNDTEIQISI